MCGYGGWECVCVCMCVVMLSFVRQSFHRSFSMRTSSMLFCDLCPRWCEISNLSLFQVNCVFVQEFAYASGQCGCVRVLHVLSVESCRRCLLCISHNGIVIDKVQATYNRKTGIMKTQKKKAKMSKQILVNVSWLYLIISGSTWIHQIETLDRICFCVAFRRYASF